MTAGPLRIMEALARALLPVACPSCGRLGPAVCERCAASFVPAAMGRPPPPLEWWTACYQYDSTVRELVARAKYRDARAALVWFAERLARAIAARAPGGVDVVTWAPASRARLAQRGIDHGAVVASIVGHELSVPARQLVRRLDATAQTGLGARARRRGPLLVATRTIDGARVLVVDDVVTTGATLAAAGRVLVAAGAARVHAAAIAHTPVPCARGPAYTPAHTPG